MLRKFCTIFFISLASISVLAQGTPATAPTQTAPQQTNTTKTDDLPVAPSIIANKKVQDEDAKKQAAQEKADAAIKAEAQRDADARAAEEKAIEDKVAADKAKEAEQERQYNAAQQNTSGQDLGDTPDIIVRASEVPVVFSVLDRHSRHIKGMKQEEFTVLEDHTPVTSIRSFKSETDLPLRVGLLVDASTSIRERFKFEQEAAIEFLNQIIRPKTDKAFVMQFDDVPHVNTAFTNNQEKLSEGVREIRAGGGTALFDAIYSAGRDVIMKQKDFVSVRKAIILLTDGEDVNSHVTREEAIEMAERAEVIIYCISTNTSTSRTYGDKILERIAEATGGRAFFPYRADEVSNAFLDIQEELRSQYSLYFAPHSKAQDGSFHTIEIVPLDKKLKAHARKGFFSPGKAVPGATTPTSSKRGN